MRRWIHASEDWRTDTYDDEVNAFRELMASNIDKQDDAEVGLFGMIQKMWNCLALNQQM